MASVMATDETGAILRVGRRRFRLLVLVVGALSVIVTMQLHCFSWYSLTHSLTYLLTHYSHGHQSQHGIVVVEAVGEGGEQESRRRGPVADPGIVGIGGN